MSENLQFERLYDQIELVQGPGSRRSGKLCIMAFVACLAGERHTDHPRTASSFIRNFALRLNDGAPSLLRQELKPFAPRLLGTNDGRDSERAAIAFRTVTEELQARIAVDFPVPSGLRLSKLLSKSHLLIQNLRAAYGARDDLLVGTLAGHIFAVLTRNAPSPAAQRWYWSKALELLDRLCDVGADRHEASFALYDFEASLRKGEASAALAPWEIEQFSKSAGGPGLIPRLWSAMKDLVFA